MAEKSASSSASDNALQDDMAAETAQPDTDAPVAEASTQPTPDQQQDAEPALAEEAVIPPPAEAPAPTEPVRHLHEGVNYLALLSNIHRQLQPTSYLEIGSESGDSLRLASCASIAVDPKFRMNSDIIGTKPALHMFQETSDSFFAKGSANALLPNGLDMAFLDGMHLFEFLLRDFIHTEKLCHWRSVVLLHDCLPPNIEIAERDYRPHLRSDEMWRIYWTGDVWKLIPILQRFRPDLRLTLFDAPPSGLVMITGLDPNNTVLRDNYTSILAEYRDFAFTPETYYNFYREQNLTPSRNLLDGLALSAFL